MTTSHRLGERVETRQDQGTGAGPVDRVDGSGRDAAVSDGSVVRPASDADASTTATGSTDPVEAGSAATPSFEMEGTPPSSRSMDGRLARLHLRCGLLSLARAELEIMAGGGTLDLEALADLAEARWRGGDLVGAAEAANVHIDEGGREPLAFIIAAEALAAEGRFTDARRMAVRVTDRAGSWELERLFAGERMSTIWSRDVVGEERPEQSRPATGHQQDEVRGARIASEETGVHDAGEGGSVPPGDEVLARDALARAELRSIEEGLARGDVSHATSRLALLLRLGGDHASAVLELADRVSAVVGEAGTDAAAIQLVRVDALTALGRAAEADDALTRSRRALSQAIPSDPSEEA